MKKLFSVFIVIALLSGLCSCKEEKAENVVFCNDVGVTQKQYSYWMAYYKTKFLNTFIGYGSVSAETYTEDFWDTDVEDKTLYDLTKAQAEQYITELVAYLNIYNENSLGSIEGAEEQIKESVDSFIDGDIDEIGSRSALNTELAKYKLNVKALSEIYELEIKKSMVEDYLFGENGTHKVTQDEREEYYKENYVRVKHVLVNTVDKYVLDDEGERVVDTSTGYYKTEKLTDEEKEEKKALAKEVYDKALAGDDFEELIEKYNEDEGMTYYTDGYFLTKDSAYEENFLNASFEMKEGEVRTVESAYGIHIIKKYALDDKGYEKEINKNFFSELDADIIDIKKKELFSKTDVKNVSSFDVAAFKALPLMDEALL